MLVRHRITFDLYIPEKLGNMEQIHKVNVALRSGNYNSDAIPRILVAMVVNCR